VELALLALLYVGYSAARLLADGDVARAVANAHDLLHLESVLHLEVERSANQLLTDVPGLALVASYWYSALHYVVTPAVLIWVYRRHALGYRRVRNALVLATATNRAAIAGAQAASVAAYQPITKALVRLLDTRPDLRRALAAGITRAGEQSGAAAGAERLPTGGHNRALRMSPKNYSAFAR